MTTQVFDKIGQEITKGCFVAYGHALGRCAGIRVGRVESVNIVKEQQYNWETQKNEPYDDVNITVLGIDDDLEHPKILKKRSTLFFSNRMVVIPNIPQNYLDLFAKDCVGLGKKHVWVIENIWHKFCKICGNGKEI